jgi:membrane protein implicated in regulation of membrane protease activity
MAGAGNAGIGRKFRVAHAVVGLLLLAPVVALLWVPSYARVTPRLFGFPFFYWYQLAWVLVGAGCLAGAYVLTMRLERQRKRAR